MVHLGYLLSNGQKQILEHKHPSISKEHAVIEFDDKGNAYLKDLNSLNQNIVNDKKIGNGAQTILKHGDVILFGKDPTKFTFLYSDDKISSPLKESKATGVGKLKDRDQKISLVDSLEFGSGVGVQQTAEFAPVTFNTRQQSQDPQGTYQQAFATKQPIIDRSPQKPQPQQQAFQRPQEIVGQEASSQYEQNPILRQFVQNTQPMQKQQQQQSPLQQQQPSPKQQTSGQSSRRDLHNAEAQELLRAQFQTELMEVHGKLLEKEETLLKREGEFKLAQNEIVALREDNEKLKAKLKAIELYASDLQRKTDLMQRELTEKNSILNNLQNTDFAQKSALNENEIKSLRKLLTTKEDEIGSLKKQLQAVLQTQRDGNINTNHYQQFLEQQAKELANTKKHLIEYENRNDECKRKWIALVKENMAKEEKIKGLTLQLNRQVENYKELFSEQDRKITAAHVKYLALVSKDPQSQEAEAAQFLVEQMQGIQEERARIAIENEQLHLQTQDLIDEIKNLNDELDSYQKYIDENITNLNNSNLDAPKPQISNSKLKKRVEELEDLVHELKQRENISRIVELTDLVNSLEQKLAHEISQNEELKSRFNNYAHSLNTINEQGTIDFFSKLLEEKDQKIVQLQKQCEFLSSKEKQYQLELEKAKEANKQLSLQFEGYKAKHSRLEEIVSKGGGASYMASKDETSRDIHIPYSSSRQADPMIITHNISDQQDRQQIPIRAANFLGTNYLSAENNIY